MTMSWNNWMTAVIPWCHIFNKSKVSRIYFISLHCKICLYFTHTCSIVWQTRVTTCLGADSCWVVAKLDSFLMETVLESSSVVPNLFRFGVVLFVWWWRRCTLLRWWRQQRFGGTETQFLSVYCLYYLVVFVLPAPVIERSTDLSPTIHYFVDDDALVCLRRLGRWCSLSFSASGDYIGTSIAVCSFYMSRVKKLLESLNSLCFAYLYIAYLCGRRARACKCVESMCN